MCAHVQVQLLQGVDDVLPGPCGGTVLDAGRLRQRGRSWGEGLPKSEGQHQGCRGVPIRHSLQSSTPQPETPKSGMHVPDYVHKDKEGRRQGLQTGVRLPRSAVPAASGHSWAGCAEVCRHTRPAGLGHPRFPVPDSATAASDCAARAAWLGSPQIPT